MIKVKACAFSVFMVLFLAITASRGAAVTGINCDTFRPDSQADVLLFVQDCYVDKIDPAVLEAAYQKGGLAEVFKLLDPHSQYLNEEERAEEDKLRREGGSFGGVGLEVSVEGKNIIVVGVIPGSPSSREDIRENDILSAVCENQTDCIVVDRKILGSKDKNAYLNIIVSKIRGKIGTPVTLKFKRSGSGKDVVVTLKRAVILPETVTAKTYGDFLNIRLRGFTDPKADKQVSEEISKVPGAKGVILDLRGNPGGLLPQANLISSLFLERKSLITSIVTRKYPKDNPEKYHAFSWNFFGTNFKMPLVVLVNQGSASASEIFTAACQDNKRCVVIGMPTFGKAIMQTQYDFGKERIRLTTGRLYRPNGKSLQGKGVIPDIIVSNSGSEAIDNEMKEARDKFSERMLPGYIKGEEEELTAEEAAKFSLIQRDRQLEMALEILKILNTK